MQRLTLRGALAPLLLTLAAISLFGACDDGSSDGNGDSSVPQFTTFDNADTEPKSRPANELLAISVTLAASEPQDFGAFSRFSFYFIELVPGYEAQYVDEPVDCETGEPVAVDGEAYLELTFTPARDVDDEGAPAHLPDFEEDAAAMPGVEEIVQTCANDEQLTFVFGLAEPDLKFRVNVLTQIAQRETIAIDIENP